MSDLEGFFFGMLCGMPLSLGLYKFAANWKVRTAMSDEEQQIRKIAQWLHLRLSAAQNLPYEEGDVCDECMDAVKKELWPIVSKEIGQRFLETIKSWRKQGEPSEFHEGPNCGKYLALVYHECADELEEIIKEGKSDE